MADQHTGSGSGSSSSKACASDDESTVNLNIKTLDSKIYSFNVEKNLTVSSFKEKIATEVGVPVGQQRLIFRGKVLKDHHPLSEYHVENGHTLHLVERQPSQAQPSQSETGTGNVGPNTNNGTRGQDPTTGGSRPRIGQISHSVVLGTLNVGDQGEQGLIPDLNRVIGAVLNSIGIGNLAGGSQPGVQFNGAQVPTPQANGTEGARSNAGTQSETGNQSQTGQAFTGQSVPNVVQIPIGATIAIPSLNSPIPDSLNTISEFINRMEQAFTRNANRTTQSPENSGDVPRVDLPLNSYGLATPEALGIVLRQAERLIREHAVPALSHTAGRLEQEASSTEFTTRGQIQADSILLGLEMQHLGALFLELGRTILTLRMGHSPVESFVNSGPAVYISPTGPNPIMAQPFPLQTSSLFGNASPSPNPGMFRPGGSGIPRNVNIHIHSGGSLSSMGSGAGARVVNREGTPGAVSGDSANSSALPSRNVIATTILSGGPGGVQTGPSPVSASLSTAISDVNSQIRNLIGTMRNNQQASQGQSESSGIQTQSVVSQSDGIPSGSSERAQEDVKTEPQPNTVTKNTEEEPSTSLGQGSQLQSSTASKSSEGSSQSTPIGLGLGGLQPKRRKSRGQGKNSDGATTSNEDRSRMVLQTLGSNRQNAEISPPPPPPSANNAGGGIDITNAMNQMLNSSAFDGLLSGVSQQTGIGSPDVLRNMMGQLTQNPAMRNTVNQIAQQIDNHDLGSMFAGMGGAQGGGIDLGRMIQQMMPVVSQALSGGLSAPAPHTPALESEVRPGARSSRRDVDLGQVVRSIEEQSSPGEVFSALVENAAQLYSNAANGGEDIVDELCGEEDLANEFMEMMFEDISRRLEDRRGEE